MDVRTTLTLLPLFFSPETPRKARVILFAEPRKSLERKEKRTQKKNKENRKTKKNKEKKNKDWRVRTKMQIFQDFETFEQNFDPDLYRANGRGGFGSQTAAARLATPQPLKKTDCGYCDSISQNSKPASPFKLSQCWRCKEKLPGPRKGFWVTFGSLSSKTAASIYTL